MILKAYIQSVITNRNVYGHDITIELQSFCLYDSFQIKEFDSYSMELIKSGVKPRILWVTDSGSREVTYLDGRVTSGNNYADYGDVLGLPIIKIKFVTTDRDLYYSDTYGIKLFDEFELHFITGLAIIYMKGVKR